MRLRQSETDDEDHQQCGNAAEHVDVHGGQESHRPAGRARQQPHDRDHQCPHQHDDLGDHEDLDVDPEALQQRPPGGPVGHGRPSEEDLRDSVVVGQQQPQRETRRCRPTGRMPTEYHAQSRARSPSCRPIRSRPRERGARLRNEWIIDGIARRREQQARALPPCDRSSTRPTRRVAGRTGTTRSSKEGSGGRNVDERNRRRIATEVLGDQRVDRTIVDEALDDRIEDLPSCHCPCRRSRRTPRRS